MAEAELPRELDSPELSVVLPTRNEANNVRPLLARLEQALGPVNFELIFVDDSDDDTESALEHAMALDPRVKVLHRPPELRRGGLSTAVVLGLSRSRGRLTCVMDADLQHPPETIPLLLQAQQGGADLVVASRYLRGGSSTGLDGSGRQLVSRLASLFARLVFPEARTSTDPLAGFFLCRTELLHGVEFRPVGFKILLELLVLFPSSKVVDVPLSFQARGSGQSKASAAQGWLFLRHVWSLLWSVPGSARRTKYAAVGLSGMALFLGTLELCGVVLGWAALAAWAVAFTLSLSWNFLLNLHFTFADMRRERYPLSRRYIASALTSGGAQLVLFLGLVGTPLPLVVDGVIAAAIGMAVNALLNYQLVHRRRRRPATPMGWDRLASQLSLVARAQRVTLVASDGTEIPTESVTQERPLPALAGPLATRALSTGIPGLWTEASSNRPQPRNNVELTSLMVLPLASAGMADRAAVLYRYAAVGFSSADLDAALRLLQRAQPAPNQAPSESADLTSATG